MNTLSYALLGLIARKPLSGYDLMRQMRERVGPLWPVGHSQIYPALAALERGGLARHNVVEQTERPDRKVYAATAAGRQALRAWIQAEASGRPLRDEFLLKTYSMWLLRGGEAQELIERERERRARSLAEYEGTLSRLRDEWKGEIDRGDSPLFASARVLEYAILHERDYLAWCAETLRLLGRGDPS